MAVAAQWEWQLHAACRGHDTEDFFPVSAAGMGARRSRPPRHLQRLCDRCPVRDECLSHALRWRETGIWGGTTDAQRAAMLRTIRRVRCPGCGSEQVLPAPGRMQVCGQCGIGWTARRTPSSSRRHRPNLGLRPRRHATTTGTP